MSAKYRVVRERLFCRELGSYHSFGILASASDGGCAYIPDVSLLEHRAYALTERLNHHDVSMCHFLDVVLDSLD